MALNNRSLHLKLYLFQASGNIYIEYAPINLLSKLFNQIEISLLYLCDDMVMIILVSSYIFYCQ